MILRVPSQARPLLRRVAGKAGELGLPLFAVGGCVRDWLLGRPTLDVDLVVEGDPQPLAEWASGAFGARAESFGQFGTWRLLKAGWRLDFARARREVYPRPAALPLVAPAPISEDLLRRDFTINALALPLGPQNEGALLDPAAGLADLRGRVLRALHEGSFRDDPTRVYRAARFVSRLHLKPAPGLWTMARESLRHGWPRLLSRARLLHELWRILEGNDPGRPLKILARLGYLDVIYQGLKPPPAVLRSPRERLGAMALRLGPRGKDFLASLPIDKALALDLRETLDVASHRRSPRRDLPPPSLAILRAAFPRLPRTALRPLFVGGEDLRALGIPPGKALGKALDEAARAQWRGRVRSRVEAIRWLKNRL
jgi:tRNA nucleotidyltransferase (CCA-adding enzyme)